MGKEENVAQGTMGSGTSPKDENGSNKSFINSCLMGKISQNYLLISTLKVMLQPFIEKKLLYQLS